jgi:hypothetical protein
MIDQLTEDHRYRVHGVCRVCLQDRYLCSRGLCGPCYEADTIGARPKRDEAGWGVHRQWSVLMDRLDIPVPASAPFRDCVTAAWVDTRGRIWMEYGHE